MKITLTRRGIDALARTIRQSNITLVDAAALGRVFAAANPSLNLALFLFNCGYNLSDVRKLLLDQPSPPTTNQEP